MTNDKENVPFATVGKSTDINWRRWSVMARGIQTEWYKSEAQAIKKADALCKANGSITWTEYTAAKAARGQQIRALPDMIGACVTARIYLSNPLVQEWLNRSGAASEGYGKTVLLLNEALTKAGVL